VQPLADPIALRSTDLGLAVLDAFHTQIVLVFMMLDAPLVLCATLRQYPEQRDVMLLEERQDPVVQNVG
jgi:hypothetical protein